MKPNKRTEKGEEEMTTRGVGTRTKNIRTSTRRKNNTGTREKKNDDGNMQMREGPGARKKELEVKSCSFFFRINPSHANLARTRGNNIGNKRHGDKEAKQFRSSETHKNTGVYTEKTLPLPRSDEKKPVPDTHKQTTFPSNDQ